ncbi:ATP-grasp domain-containing protein, partial [Listeria monocytogenes]|nr:ATP-grasp domain-containing protein [Listeria monocytogenes]EAF6859387.1 ATP-grasp domain-containing protein [Listeria monocytogenes]HAC1125016.1 ATP-grasp domain-containing protein [Listeria monocytogenes]
VISMREKDIIHAAYIREHFELMGQTISSAMAFRDKYVMKNLAIQNNIKVPIFSKVNTFFDVVNFTNKNKFPVVVKPRLGAGSVDTFIINNSLEMEENLRGVDLKNFIIEEFIDGSIFHVDGLIKDGEIEFIIPSKYINECIEYKIGKSTSSFTLEKNNILYTKLIKYTLILLKKFPTPQNTTFHLEVFITHDGEIILCEVASRTAGGKIPKCIEYRTGTDMNRTWFRNQLGLLTEENSVKREMLYGSIQCAPKHGKLTSIPKELPFDWVKLYEVYAKEGDFYQGATSSVFAIASVIVEGESEQDVTKRLNQVDEYIKLNTIYI